MASKDVATRASTELEYPITGDSVELIEAFRENMGTGGLSVFDLDRVKMPTGGSTHWSIPTLEGDDRAASELDGIIVAWREPRAYWKLSIDEGGGGNPPDCSSSDGITGVGDPGGDCVTCPMAQFGSAPPKMGSTEPGRGQACKQMRLVLVVQPEERIPTALFLPPTSLKVARNYFLRLSSKGLKFYDVVTRFKLEKARNQGGIDYAEATPAVLRVLEPEERAGVRSYAEAIMGSVSVDMERMRPDDTDSSAADDGQ